jgi:hypothetical protein
LGRTHSSGPIDNLALLFLVFADCLLLVVDFFCFSNQQAAISNVVIPLTFILSPLGLTITHIFFFNKKQVYPDF